MKLYLLALIIGSLIFAGCQKSPDSHPETLPEPSAASATESPDQAKDDVPETKDDATDKTTSSSPIHSFSGYGLDDSVMSPSFSAGMASRNGDFVMTKPGMFRIFLVSDDEAIMADAFVHYTTDVYNHVKSVADDGKVYGYDVEKDTMLAELSVVPNATLSEPFTLSYKYQGKSVSVYINYKTYRPGLLANISTPARAVYVGIYDIIGQ